MKRRQVLLAAIGVPLFIAAAAFGWWWQSEARHGRYRDLLTAFYVMGIVKTSYYQPVNLSDLAKAYWRSGNITGMLKILNDPYTRYLGRNEYAELKKETEGSFGGIGVYLIPKADQLLISSVVKGTPGEKAGLQPGDQIIKVNDEEVKQLTVEVAIAKIRGPAGSAVKLQIARGQGDNRRAIDFRIIRELVLIPTVQMDTKTDPVLGKYGVVKISQFAETTPDDLAKALAKIDGDPSYRGAMLDLRANPGGSLDAAHKVASHFIPAGVPVLHIIRRGYPEQTLPAKNYPHRKLPWVVLVDSWSASAAEIVSGAIKDNHRATLIGTRTFGKDLIQEVKELPGESAVTITIASYLTSGRVNIHKRGVHPDQVVEIPGALDRLLQKGDSGPFQKMQQLQEAAALKALRQEAGPAALKPAG